LGLDRIDQHEGLLGFAEDEVGEMWGKMESEELGVELRYGQVDVGPT
jgi:hypothetical protein